MRPLKKFDEFLETGIARRREPDQARANSLITEALKRNTFFSEVVKKIEITDENANYYIENSYDILIELIRAKILQDGFYCSGEGAHEAEVAYMEKLGFSEADIRFMNDLRYFRNGILYYGKRFDKEYADKVLKFLQANFEKLVKLSK